jgi:hypothetical protein
MTPAVPPQDGGAVLAAYALYPIYLFTCEFTQAPFAYIPDNDVPVRPVTFYDEAGAPYDSVVAEEWRRYTSYDLETAGEIVEAQFGQLVYRVDDGTAPNAKTFPGKVRMVLPKSVVKFTWHNVPASLVERPDSPMVRYLGYLNQEDFVLLGQGPEYLFPAGSLLYMALGVRRYLPPVPLAIPGPGGVSFSLAKNADIQFICQWVNRDPTKPPPEPANANWLATGHNLEPWYGDRGFYYVTASDGAVAPEVPDETKWAPKWQSFPLEWLWTDPDYI